MSEPLKGIEQLIFNGKGPLFEADLAAVAKHSPFFVRAFEFGLADAGIDCTTQYHTSDSFADRFWDLECRQLGTARSEILLVDFKSTIDADQHLLTTVAQRRRVAVFIAVCAGNTSMVDVIPNYMQDPTAFHEDGHVDEGDRRGVSFAFTGTSRLGPLSAGGLNLSNSPYRMPLRLLPTAINLIRGHVRGERVYRNPYTLVEFSDWHPITVQNSEYLKPSEPGHRSAYEAVMAIFQAMKRFTSMRPDFVGLQPRLADFKLIDGARQWFIQHKLEARLRSPTSEVSLKNVSAARPAGLKWRYFFNAHERFDFLWYQMEFSQLPNPRPRVEFFFLPERILPDEFYTTDAKEVDFDLPEFLKADSIHTDKEGRRGYKIHMDEEGRWVEHVMDIIAENSRPRKAGERPMRQCIGDVTAAAEPEAAKANAALPAKLVKSGHGNYRQIMDTRHRQFFREVMMRCAHRRSGLLVALPRNHAFGDFGYCRYRWTSTEEHNFREYGIPPQVLHDLSPHVELLCICFYTRDIECTYTGTMLTYPEFRRLDSTHVHRLTIWDLGGADAIRRPLPLAMIPSDDIRPTASQRAKFEANKTRKSDVWSLPTPTLGALLNSRFHPAEYTLSNGGPLAFAADIWNDLLDQMDRFTGFDAVEHPRNSGSIREPVTYRHAVQSINQRQVREHARKGALDEGLYDD